MMRHLKHDEKILSVFATFVVHGILLLLFLLIQINFNPVIEEFTEITFAGGWEAPVLERQPPKENVLEEDISSEDETVLPIPEKIELPERRQLELNEDEIVEKLQPEIEKMVTQGNIVKKSPTEIPPLPEIRESGPTFDRSEKQIEKGIFRKQLDEKLLEGSQKVQINPDRQFKIDWEGEIRREVYQRRMPEFPPEVQREATIKIQFTVIPNGLIGSAVILQKGDTRLENMTLEAFKTWRFNPLPSYVEQVPQQGVITFHFKLK